jgi:shikimate dehydrogenase
MPLKEVAFKVADEVDVRAKRINSANTLYRRGTGWSASSTDLLAFDNLISLPIDSKVAIIGGGGTARAAAGALNSKVAAFDVLIRNPERLAELSKSAPDVDIRVLEMSAPLDGYDFVIQTTPSGVFDKYAIGLKNASGTLLECLYNPWPTLLAKNFLALGGSVISGKQLLVEQALFQIELFTQIQFDFAMMRTQLIAHIDEK